MTEKAYFALGVLVEAEDQDQPRQFARDLADVVPVLADNNGCTFEIRHSRLAKSGGTARTEATS